MAEIFGTTGDDILSSFGGTDYLSGGDGMDTYALSQGAGGSTVTIEDMGQDGAIDTITGGRGLYSSASFGYESWATAERIDDDLIITLPGQPSRFRKPGYGELTIEITDQYAGGAVEYLEMGGVSYRLADSFVGTIENDIIAGTSGRDIIESYAGNDFIDAGAGNDKVLSGDGDDVVFGGEGRNVIKTGDGNDLVFSGTGNDTIITGAGNDRVDAGDGNNKVVTGAGNDQVSTGDGDDLVKGGSGDDVIDAGDGNNTVYGGSGNDRIVTGSGDDVLIGGTGGDTYVISSLGSDFDTIIDTGNAALKSYGWLTWNMDEVEFTDFSSLDEAKHSLDIQISVNDLTLTYWNAATPGVSGQISVQDHFLGAKYALEQVDFGVGGVSAIYHIAQLSGDDYTYSVHGGSDAGGNDIVLGTVGGDKIYGGLGGDIMVGGGGADLYIFHDEEDGGGSTDLILDFDITDDLLDFSDIKGLDFSGVTISNSAYGNALISTAYGLVELVDVAFDTVSEDAFVFNGTTPAPDPGTGPAPEPGPTPGGVPITGTAGSDELIGTDFADRFIFTADTAFEAVDEVKDFLVEHGDMLDITDLLIGFDLANDAISDFAMLIRDPESDDVTLAIDRDGTAATCDAQDVAFIVDGASLDIQTLFDDGLLLA